jgi:thiol-disulfide isomerase/thioredoxin
MRLSLHNFNSRNRLSLRLFAGALILSLFAAACGGSDDDLAAAAAAVDPVETNGGGILVKPPDVLEGDPAEPPSDLPSLVDGLDLTPIVPFEYFDGTLASTAEFKGRPTVLNFWASNCAACVAEMPDFEEVHLALGDRVDFVGMNTADVSREAAVALAAQTGVSYPLADDTTSVVFREFGGFVMPTTVFLNAQGQVAGSWAGVLTADELTRLINENLLPE